MLGVKKVLQKGEMATRVCVFYLRATFDEPTAQDTAVVTVTRVIGLRGETESGHRSHHAVGEAILQYVNNSLTLCLRIATYVAILRF